MPVAGRLGFSTLLIEKAMMNLEVGYGRRLLEILEKNAVSCEHAPTSIDTMSVMLRDEEIAGKTDILLREITETLQPDRAQIKGGCALIATVGEGMIGKAGIAARLLTALAEADVNLCMINQGVSEINIIIGVTTADYEIALRAIHGALVEAAN